MPLSSNVRMYCSKYSLSSMTTVRWWKLTCVVELGSVVYSAATSQFLPIPVPDVLFAIHVSTMWTTALGHCQTLCAVNRQDGRFLNMQCHQILKWHTYRHARTAICTQSAAQMHMRWYKWEFSLGGTLEHERNHLFSLALFSSTPLALSPFLLVYFYSCEYIIL